LKGKVSGFSVQPKSISQTNVYERLRTVRWRHVARLCPHLERGGTEQNNALQTRALRAAGYRRLFEETASGGRWDRPELHRLLDQLREGDMVVVWKLDRLSRSLKDVLHIMECIGNAGAGFRSITGTPKRKRHNCIGR